MIMVRLRQKTLRLHLRLKQGIDLFHHFSTLEDYRRLLERYQGFYEPVESALERHFNRRAGGLDFEPRRKSPMLVRDLRALGVKQFTTLPRCASLPAISSTPHAFGCLYTLEISTLGGQIITRHLNRVFGVSPESGCSFFHSYGDQTVMMWRDLGQQIKKYAVTDEIEEAMIEAAVETFVKLEEWMAINVSLERPQKVLKLVAGGRWA
jgi:heme oxygenase